MPARNDGRTSERRTAYRGRFAPSPTGPLHIGSLFTALASFLQARSQRGEWLLRIDDIDRERSSPVAADSVRQTLERFQLHWDGPVVYQQQRIERYRAAFEMLHRQGWVYGCRCSRKLLAGHPIYPGTCRNPRTAESSAYFANRVITEGVMIRFSDKLHGPVVYDLAGNTGDFIVRRRDGVYAYHLATVVDDADAEISEIVRGSDLLDSTPRQVYLQQLLQLPTPAYCHTPVVVGTDGRKLSKQDFAAPVDGRNPSATLFQLLVLLRQCPPLMLQGAPVREILDWAVAHWDIQSLRQIGAIGLFPQAAPRSGNLA